MGGIILCRAQLGGGMKVFSQGGIQLPLRARDPAPLCGGMKKPSHGSANLVGGIQILETANTSIVRTVETANAGCTFAVQIIMSVGQAGITMIVSIGLTLRMNIGECSTS